MSTVRETGENTWEIRVINVNIIIQSNDNRYQCKLLIMFIVKSYTILPFLFFFIFFNVTWQTFKRNRYTRRDESIRIIRHDVHTTHKIYLYKILHYMAIVCRDDWYNTRLYYNAIRMSFREEKKNNNLLNDFGSFSHVGCTDHQYDVLLLLWFINVP